MPAKVSFEQFLNRISPEQRNKYSYSKAIYVNQTTKIEIVCPEHGSFWQRPYAHLTGAGCKKCGFWKNKEEQNSEKLKKLIEKSNLKYNGFYTFPRAVYVRDGEKMTITCPDHGDFEQSPLCHLQGIGCEKCRKQKKRKDFVFHDQCTYLKLINSLYPENDHSKVVFTRLKDNITLICKEHGEFQRIASIYLKSGKCPKCNTPKGKFRSASNEKIDQKLIDRKLKIRRIGEHVSSRVPIEWECLVDDCNHRWFAESNAIFTMKTGCPKCNNRIPLTNEDVDKRLKDQNRTIIRVGDFKNSKSLLKWKCTDCNRTWNKSFDAVVLNWRGCSFCSTKSIGETRIKCWLEKHGFDFSREKTFPDCRHKRPLPFDFVIFNVDDSVKCLIEFDGSHHYGIWGDKKYKVLKNDPEYFENIKKRDEIKTKYCQDNEIKLIRIPYWDFKNIESILSEHLLSNRS